MAHVALYTQAGKNNGTIDVSDVVFAADQNNAVVHQVYTALEANARESWAKTKDRSEVRGGGKKPWKQKGTGRARHGSTRSPIWSGGGVTFGPLSERNYKQKVNRKMNKLAVRVCLSEKVRNESLVALEDLSIEGKTKELAAMRDVLPFDGTLLLIVGEVNEAVTRAIRNIPKFHMVRAIDVNVVDLLHHKHVLVTKDGIDVLTERLIA